MLAWSSDPPRLEGLPADERTQQLSLDDAAVAGCRDVCEASIKGVHSDDESAVMTGLHPEYWPAKVHPMQRDAAGNDAVERISNARRKEEPRAPLTVVI